MNARMTVRPVNRKEQMARALAFLLMGAGVILIGAGWIFHQSTKEKPVSMPELQAKAAQPVAPALTPTVTETPPAVPAIPTTVATPSLPPAVTETALAPSTPAAAPTSTATLETAPITPPTPAAKPETLAMVTAPAVANNATLQDKPSSTGNTNPATVITDNKPAPPAETVKPAEAKPAEAPKPTETVKTDPAAAAKPAVQTTSATEPVKTDEKKPTETTTTDTTAATTGNTGWIYAGQFINGKWVERGLVIGEELPAAGQSYALNWGANIRSEPPGKDTSLSKTVGYFAQGHSVSIVQVRKSGSKGHVWLQIKR